MAVEYDGGVIIGADSRTTTGYVDYQLPLLMLLPCLRLEHFVSIILQGL